MAPPTATREDAELTALQPPLLERPVLSDVSALHEFRAIVMAHMPDDLDSISLQSSDNYVLPLSPSGTYTFPLEMAPPLLPLRRVNNSGLSCAVIAKSGILLHAEHGRLIDSHDIVIRVNMPPVLGFENHVGSKTTMITINQVSIMRCAEDFDLCVNYFVAIRTSIVLLRFTLPTCKKSTAAIAERLLALNDRTEKLPFTVYFENVKWRRAFHLAVRKILGEKLDLTTGTDMIVHCLMRCSSTSIYGFFPFDKLPSGQRIPLYFYNNSAWELAQLLHRAEPVMEKVHAFDKQQDLLLKWNSSGLLALYYN